jgi:hypothetical protein
MPRAPHSERVYQLVAGQVTAVLETVGERPPLPLL